jgi:hypothetical protein
MTELKGKTLALGLNVDLDRSSGQFVTDFSPELPNIALKNDRQVL